MNAVLGLGFREMFYRIYDLPAWTAIFLFALVFIGTSWFGVIFICRRPVGSLLK